MGLSKIFEKPVDRPIEGVIKADDEASLRLEVEEYVLTNEVSKRFENFLNAYNNYENANGVWISGFFGSGKSHLLKMLALLLENRSIEKNPVLELFLPKCADNEIFRGDLKRAVSIPSKSILFNIDQKADVISKTQIDALLSVFVKVFDNMCGYYGKQGYIAQFERDLDNRSLYEPFKKAYYKNTNREWTSGREQALLESKNIATAYAEVTKDSEADAKGILDKYRSQYKVSIEDFAAQVKEYIEQQEPKFRLNFFVDEVGQYIAENIKLMTNLQTIAESLATACRGRAWIIVTAQEDMDSVVGEMGKQRSNDFSKIQARFSNRMKLTSSDVAEVIQKRLLLKNDEGIEKLSQIYQNQSNNFKTLFDFTDNSQTYRNFQDREHFIHSYPFIPYQFVLFQSAISNLSKHNAFEGKHSSVGERSMLGVFQQVSIQIADHEIGELATFDLMFEGIRTALKSDIQRAILTAEKHLDNSFAVQILKALFLVKYIKEFKATIRNICVLMLKNFDQNLPELRKKVEEALNLLEQQTYIQRNGDEFEFLTDEEKDIEQEIKNTDVEPGDINDELGKIIFDHILKERKIRYEENKQFYPFSRKLDERLIGREYELTIHVISPFHENSDKEEHLRMQSMGRDELLLWIPPDDRLIIDLPMYKRTEKYIRQNISTTQQETIKRILTEKRSQNKERYDDLQRKVSSSLGKARLFVAGDEVELSGEDPVTKITKGFQKLIERTYPNLMMLRGINYAENDIVTCLQQSKDGLFKNDEAVLSESEQEILAFIQNNNREGIRTTLKNLVEKFERKTYGWYLAAIQCILAKLYARGKIEIRTDGNLLESSEIEKALRNNHEYANIILESQREFTPSQVRQLKEFYEDFFDGPPRSSEAKALGSETSVAFQKLYEELSLYLKQTEQYPFLESLKLPLHPLKELEGKPYTFYLTEIQNLKEDLLDSKENIFDPIRRFMNGTLKDLFEETRKFVQSEKHNFGYIENEEAQELENILSNKKCYQGNQMQQAKKLMESLKKKIHEKVEEEKNVAIKTVTALKLRFNGMEEFGKLSSEIQTQLAEPFDNFFQVIQEPPIIAVIRDTLNSFKEEAYPKLLTAMCDWALSDPSKNESLSASKNESAKTVKPKMEIVKKSSLQISFDKAWLADESDVDLYLSALKKALMEEINKGKRVQI